MNKKIGNQREALLLTTRQQQLEESVSYFLFCGRMRKQEQRPAGVTMPGPARTCVLDTSRRVEEEDGRVLLLFSFFFSERLAPVIIFFPSLFLSLIHCASVGRREKERRRRRRRKTHWDRCAAVAAARLSRKERRVTRTSWFPGRRQSTTTTSDCVWT